MSRFLVCCLSLTLSVAALSPVLAQGPRGLIAPSELSRFGLDRLWFTQVQVDPARGRVIQLQQHVSASESTTIFEVVAGNKKYVYRETDIDHLGRVIGKTGAERLADLKVLELQGRRVQAEKVTRTVPRITVYAATDSGGVHAIDGETGRTRWKTAVGSPNYPTQGVAANDQYVVAVNGPDVFLLKVQNGDLVWQRKVNGAPGAGPTISNSMAFVPMINGMMGAYPLEDPRLTPVNFRSIGSATVQPIFTGSNVAWPTDRGYLYVTGAQNTINYRLETNHTIVAPASFLPPNKLVVASVDGFVYCLHETSGSVQWRFSIGEPIVTVPAPYGNIVYAVTTAGRLFAIDANSGLELWSVNHMSRVVGASQKRLYCLSDTNRLTILERDTGSRLGSLSTELNDLFYVNLTTDRLLFGTTRGVLQCVRDAAQEYPILHVPLQKSEPEEGKRPRRETKSVEPPKDVVDPFKGARPLDSVADPFDIEPGPKPKTPAGGLPEADPFRE